MSNPSKLAEQTSKQRSNKITTKPFDFKNGELMDTIPSVLRPRNIDSMEKLKCVRSCKTVIGHRRLNSAKMVKDLARLKPLDELPLVLIPTARHPVYPPLFYWGISLPIPKIMDFVEDVRAHTDKYSGSYATLLRGYDRIDYTPGIVQKNGPLIVTVTEKDLDGEDPIVPNEPLSYDVLVVDFALACLEEHLGIPVGTMRAQPTAYRNYHPVLGFFSSYETPDSRMTDDEISLVYEAFDIEEDELLGWWCSDPFWTVDMKEP
jgi:hypothetical protein